MQRKRKYTQGRHTAQLNDTHNTTKKRTDEEVNELAVKGGLEHVERLEEPRRKAVVRQRFKQVQHVLGKV
jgi:hypothetical protein